MAFFMIGSTQVHHDVEDFVTISHCTEEDCFQLQVQYNASINQMTSLIDLSQSCYQEFKV